jgi:hypothetical protein
MKVNIINKPNPDRIMEALVLMLQINQNKEVCKDEKGTAKK